LHEISYRESQPFQLVSRFVAAPERSETNRLLASANGWLFGGVLFFDSSLTMSFISQFGAWKSPLLLGLYEFSGNAADARQAERPRRRTRGSPLLLSPFLPVEKCRKVSKLSSAAENCRKLSKTVGRLFGRAISAAELLTAARPDLPAPRKSRRAMGKGAQIGLVVAAYGSGFLADRSPALGTPLLGWSSVGRPKSANKLLTEDQGILDIIQHMETVCD
jgi:hypothetical protein